VVAALCVLIVHLTVERTETAAPVTVHLGFYTVLLAVVTRACTFGFGRGFGRGFRGLGSRGGVSSVGSSRRFLEEAGGVGAEYLEAAVVTKMLDVTVAHYVILAFGHLPNNRKERDEIRGDTGRYGQREGASN
jgi:hypothetical protein